MSKSIVLMLTFFFVCFNEINSQSQKIYVTRIKNPDNSVDFTYTKSEPGNYFIEFDLENVTNVVDISGFKKSYNISLSDNSGSLFKLYPVDKEKPIDCSYTYSYKSGLVKPVVDQSIVYLLPFKENKNVTIYESARFNVKPEIWKNYSVYSKTKDTIYAMRKGVVTDIKKISIANNGKTVFKTQVVVDHADGTNASYTGLDDKLLNIKVNDLIFPGSRLGVMDDLIDDNMNRNFKFNIYYFSDEEMEGINGKNVKVIERSIMPVFYTREGHVNLVVDKNYTVKYDDEVVCKEMTAQEKENYKSQIRS